ncbi:MAG: alkaline phosphatase D family protein [Candidatus Thiodiazotropha sp.]
MTQTVLVTLAGMMASVNGVAAPMMEQGIQIGDITDGRAIVWSRSDQPSRMMVEYATQSDFSDAILIKGPYATEQTDYTARQDLVDLPAGSDIHVKVWFEDLTQERNPSEALTGQFHMPGRHENIRFVWGGDIAGQGWGINEAFGGMRIYESMRQVKPLFFINSGDTVYADGPILPQVTAENGEIWTNRVTTEVSKVAETLDEFRGRYKYNLLDTNILRFNAQVPQIWQWDDHEVMNNWSDAKDLSADSRYTVKDMPLLVSRATQAFHEYAPLRPHGAEEANRIYRKLSYGDLLDVFVLDMRSYRGANSDNLQYEESDATAFLGPRQADWLMQSLKESTATWKVIAADMPIGLNISDDYVNDPPQQWEGIANGNDGPAAGRELEIARILSYIKHRHIQNVVWLTADVHYAAAHYYNPRKAVSDDFSPFWEFIAGPLNAGSFGPNSTDATFGPEVVFNLAPAQGQSNLSPYAGLQFFGEVSIDRRSREMTVSLKDIDGESVFTQKLSAQRRRGNSHD